MNKNIKLIIKKKIKKCNNKYITNIDCDELLKQYNTLIIVDFTFIYDLFKFYILKFKYVFILFSFYIILYKNILKKKLNINKI
jgi:hypothetical protein